MVSIMPSHIPTVHQSAPALLVPVLLVLIVCCRPGQALCESRCERSNPDLGSLRTLWMDSFRWMAGRSISFEHFLLTLVREPEGGRTRNRVLDIVARYESCMYSCEHQFSKRSAETQRPQTLKSRLLKSRPRSQPSSRSKYASLIHLLRIKLFFTT